MFGCHPGKWPCTVSDRSDNTALEIRAAYRRQERDRTWERIGLRSIDMPQCQGNHRDRRTQARFGSRLMVGIVPTAILPTNQGFQPKWKTILRKNNVVRSCTPSH